MYIEETEKGIRLVLEEADKGVQGEDLKLLVTQLVTMNSKRVEERIKNNELKHQKFLSTIEALVETFKYETQESSNLKITIDKNE